MKSWSEVKRVTEVASRYYQFGYKKFGPFLYGFVTWLKDELVKAGYTKVCFFSRDGFMMKKAFDLINDTEVTSEYVYFSRKSLRMPLMTEVSDYKESLKYLARERYISLGKLLEYYGFEETERQKIADKYGFELGEDIPYDALEKNEKGKRIYLDHQEIIHKRAVDQDKLLMSYLKQMGMEERFAIVDIGWHGNMQYYLELFMKKHGMPTVFGGYYIGIDPVNSLSTPVNGFLFNKKDLRNRKRLICFFGGYEKLFQSFEGSVTGYGKSSECVIPTLMQYEYEGDETIIQVIKEWQKGALVFVKRASAKSLQIQKKQLTEPLIRFGMYPSLADTRLFAFFYIIDGNKVYFTAQKRLWNYRLKELIHAFANSPWKTGFMKSVFVIPFPYYLIYLWLKK